MKRNAIITFTILLGLIVITSSSRSQDDSSTKRKKSTMVINIKNNDTTYNGKPYDQLSNEEKIRLKEIQEDIMQKQIDIEAKMKEIERIQVLKPSPSYPPKPRHPRAPSKERLESRLIVIPEVPDAPSFDHFNEFSIAPNNKSQSFTYNDGDTFLSIKMLDATETELNKINSGENADHKVKLIVDPLANKLSLNYQFNNSGKLEIKIYDDAAKIVKSEAVKNYEGKEARLEFNLADFESGKYFVEFNLNGTKIYKKLFINKK